MSESLSLLLGRGRVGGIAGMEEWKFSSFLAMMLARIVIQAFFTLEFTSHKNQISYPFFIDFIEKISYGILWTPYGWLSHVAYLWWQTSGNPPVLGPRPVKTAEDQWKNVAYLWWQTAGNPPVLGPLPVKTAEDQWKNENPYCAGPPVW